MSDMSTSKSAHLVRIERLTYESFPEVFTLAQARACAGDNSCEREALPDFDYRPTSDLPNPQRESCSIKEIYSLGLRWL